MAPRRTGLLVIRTWSEPDSPEPFRASVRVALDVSKGFEDEVTVFNSDVVLQLVAQWLATVRNQPND